MATINVFNQLPVEPLMAQPRGTSPWFFGTVSGCAQKPLWNTICDKIKWSFGRCWHISIIMNHCYILDYIHNIYIVYIYIHTIHAITLYIYTHKSSKNLYAVSVAQDDCRPAAFCGGRPACQVAFPEPSKAPRCRREWWERWVSSMGLSIVMDQ